MISVKFQVGDQEVSIQTDNAMEAMQVLSAVSANVEVKNNIENKTHNMRTGNYKEGARKAALTRAANNALKHNLYKERALKAAKTRAMNSAMHTKGNPYYVKNSKHSPRAWARWTMEEVRALNEHKNLKTNELVKIPVLAGRNRATLVNMRGVLRHPASLHEAPTNFRKFAEVVLAEA